MRWNKCDLLMSAERAELHVSSCMFQLPSPPQLWQQRSVSPRRSARREEGEAGNERWLSGDEEEQRKERRRVGRETRSVSCEFSRVCLTDSEKWNVESPADRKLISAQTFQVFICEHRKQQVCVCAPVCVCAAAMQDTGCKPSVKHV